MRAGFYKSVLHGRDGNGGGWGNLDRFSSFRIGLKILSEKARDCKSRVATAISCTSDMGIGFIASQAAHYAVCYGVFKSHRAAYGIYLLPYILEVAVAYCDGWKGMVGYL